MSKPAVELNGIEYQYPSQPIVVVCIDGGDPAYIKSGLRDGIIPNIERFMQNGFHTVAEGTVPSFTCPNNMSIVTGKPPAVHGISGNFYLDPATGEAVVMTGPELLRTQSVMASFSQHGAKVVSITAKDKLRQQLAKNLDLSGGSVSLSSQYADRCTMAENGIEDVLDFVGQPLPDMYSQELSLFVLDAGIKLLETRRPDILYLSLTDFVQHAHAPGTPEANDFYINMDQRFGRLAELGAIVALTADHGMNDKSKEDGTPNVIWLQDVLDDRFGTGSSTVICPITDAFVGHHGALGGFVRVYCKNGLDPRDAIAAIKDIAGIEGAYAKSETVERFELPADREGDVAVISDAGTCIGAREQDHDLSALKGHRLRTHGGVSEAKVPIIISHPVDDRYAARAEAGVLKSYEVFDFAINGTAAGAAGG
ncbi:MAG: phosphonoacetate hydrolase [Alphaproteobacteria bacterium]|nr:phosphonoacetate hydrolase [Alphaproteobacteria bacterium]